MAHNFFLHPTEILLIRRICKRKRKQRQRKMQHRIKIDRLIEREKESEKRRGRERNVCKEEMMRDTKNIHISVMLISHPCCTSQNCLTEITNKMQCAIKISTFIVVQNILDTKFYHLWKIEAKVYTLFLHTQKIQRNWSDSIAKIN